MNRHSIISANKDIQKYHAFDSHATFYGVLFRSSIVICQFCDIFTTNEEDYGLVKLRNTINIISFEVLKNNLLLEKAPGIINNLFSQYINALYQYDVTTSKSHICKIKFSNIYRYEWPKLNINLFDIYQIIFHISHKKYYRLEKQLTHLVLVKSPNILDTLNILINFYNYFGYNQTDLQIKAVIIYLMYDFIDSINVHEIIKYVNFTNTIIVKTNQFTLEISKIKAFPNYMKYLLVNKLRHVSTKLSYHK